jgi:hypothetical protein
MTDDEKADWVHANAYDPEKDTCAKGTSCSVYGKIVDEEYAFIQTCQECNYKEGEVGAVAWFDLMVADEEYPDDHPANNNLVKDGDAELPFTCLEAQLVSLTVSAAALAVLSSLY